MRKINPPKCKYINPLFTLSYIGEYGLGQHIKIKLYEYQIISQNVIFYKASFTTPIQVTEPTQAVCPAGTLFFPVILGEVIADCSVDMTLDAMTTEESGGRIFVAGHVDTTSAGTCNRFTATQAQAISFLAQINSQGNYDWVNLLSLNNSVTVTALSSTSLYSFASLYLTQSVFRLAKITSATGSQIAELNGDQFISQTGNLVDYIALRGDNQTNELYVAMKLNTGVFSYSGDENVYFKLSSTFEVSWFKRVHGLAANPSYLPLDSFVGSTNLWQLVKFYTDLSTQSCGIQKISKTDGSILSEQIFSNDQATLTQGSIRLSKNESHWYTTMYYGSTSAQSIQYGTTTQNDLLKFYKTTDVFTYVGLAIPSSGNFIIMGLQNGCQIVQQFKLTRGSATYSMQTMGSLQSGGTIVLAAQAPNLLGISSKRIIVYKTDDSLKISSFSCVNTTATSFAAYTLVAANSVTSASPLYTPVQETPTSYLFSQAFLSFRNQSQASYLLRDTQASLFCDLLLTSQAQTFSYSISSAAGTTVHNPLPIVSDCTGQEYSFSAVTFPDGTSKSNLQIVGSNLDIRFLSGYQDNSGNRPFFLNVNDKGVTKRVAIQIIFTPDPTSLRTETTPNHNIDACNEQIYPLQYGFNFEYHINSMDLDSYGNLLLAGQAYGDPFAYYSVLMGFFQMMDQRGNQYWTQALSFSLNTNQISSCNLATYQTGDYVYGSCKMASEYFLYSLKFLYFLKLNHKTGQVVYSKKIPNDIDPSSQEIYTIQDVGTNQIFASYSAKRNGYNGFVNLIFSDSTNTIGYYKFYNYMNRDTQYQTQTLMNSTTDTFWVIRQEQTYKVVILKGKISDGSLTTALTLSDVSTTGPNSFIMGSQQSSGQNLVIPALDPTTRILYIYVIATASLNVVQTIMISFPAAYKLSTASVDFDAIGNIYAAVGGKQIYWTSLASDYSTVRYQKVWTGSGQSTFSASISGARYYNCNTTTGCSTSSYFTAFQSQVSTSSYSKSGGFIFKGSSIENCFDIRDIDPSNSTWYPIITQITAASTLTTFADISIDFGNNTDNYPLIYDSYIYQQISFYKYSKWGVTEIQDIKEYKAYPLGQFYCGNIARQKQFQTNNGVGTIVEVVRSGSSTPTVVQINTTITNCQGRTLSAVLWNPYYNSNTIGGAQTSVYSSFSSSKISVSNTATQYHQQSFKVRYYDSYYGNSVYFYDHAFLIRFVSQTNITQSKAHNISNCAQTPFPIGLGGEQSNTNNGLLACNIIADESDYSIYVNGKGGDGSNFIDPLEADYSEAVIMRVSQSGAIIWLNSMNQNSLSNQMPGGMTLAFDNIYVGIYSYSGSATWSNNQNTLLKLTKNEGKLVWGKKILARNIIGNFFLTFNINFDMLANPRNQSQIMASVQYICCSGSGFPTGQIMMYDNGIDIQTLYDYQFKPTTLQTTSNSGRIAYDPDTDSVYISTCVSINSSSTMDILLLKLDSTSGIQIWNRYFTIYSASNPQILQPIILINNLTKYVYVSSQVNDANFQIVRMNQDGTIDMHKVIKTSTYTYANMDITTDHSNGNLIIIGNTETTIYQLIFMNSDINYLRGQFIMHAGKDSPKYRMISQVGGFFYYLQGSSGFSQTYSNLQIVIGKKSLLPFEIQRYECHTYIEQMTNAYTLVTNLQTTIAQIPNNVVFFSNQTLFFMADFNPRVRNSQPYFTKMSFSPDISDAYSMVGTSGSVACNSIGGGKLGPPGDFAIALEVVKGNTTVITFSSDMFFMQNCQGDSMSFQSTIFPSETQITSAAYITKQTTTQPYYVQIDASGATTPYPGVRWMTINFQVNSLSSSVLMPIYVYPTVTPNATLTKQDSICSNSDPKFPKLIGYPSAYSNSLNDADIDQDNGNILVCGNTSNPLMQVIDFRSGNKNSFIALFDQNGQLQWGFSGLAFSEGSYAASCKFSAGQKGVYNLIMIESTSSLLLAKIDYVTGKVLYIRQVQGFFINDISTISMKIDYQYNQAYITSGRTDISNSTLYVSGYVAKLNLNSEYPVQQYYSYMHWLNSDANQHNINSMQVTHDQDYLVTLGRMIYSSTYYAAIVLSSKTTGQYIASTYYQSITQVPGQQLYHDIVADDSYIYYAFSQYNPKQISIVKLQIPTLAQVVSNGHSFIDGISYSVISLSNDTDYIYALSIEPGQYYQYLTKFSKSDLSIVTSVYWNDRSNSQNAWQRMIIYGQQLFVFYTNGLLPGGYQAGVINQFTLTLQQSSTCTEVIPFTPITQNSASPFNPSGVVEFIVEVGDQKNKPWSKYYFEYWLNTSIYFMYDTKIKQNCSFKEPKFTTELYDQILQLPIGSAQTYTFDWPVDCFNSSLTFKWSVDTYTQSNKPSFLSFTTTSASSTLSMNPTTSNIGTYIVRVRFELTSNPNIFTEKTFVVEVYPEISYGQKSFMCPTSNILALFYQGGSTTTQWNRMDMDSQALNFVICGWTKMTQLNKNPSFYAGFLSSFTLGMNLNFHITIQFLKDTSYCFTNYLNSTYIYSLYSYMTLQTSYADAFSVYRHTSSGQYSKGRTYTTGLYVQVSDYSLDQTAGYSYIFGNQQGTFLNNGNQKELFIFKLDKDLAYISGNTYGFDTSLAYSRSIVIISTNIFVTFEWQNPSSFYSKVLTSLSQTDGSIAWVKIPYTPSQPQFAQAYNTKDFPHQDGMIYYQNYLYTCFAYKYNSVTPPYDVYFAKINPSTGDLMQKMAWSTQSNPVYEIQLLGLISNPDNVLVSLSIWNIHYFTIINVASSTSFSVGNTVSFNFNFGKAVFAINLLERNSLVWGFSRLQTAQQNGGSGSFIYKLTTANFGWDAICTFFQRSSDSYMYSLPTGSGNDYILNWQDFPSSNPLKQWTIPSKLYNRWFSNIMNAVMYPINNSSANTRQSDLPCKSYAAPTAPSINSRLGPAVNSTSGGFNVMSLTQNLILPAFDQCSGDLMIYSLAFANGSSLSSGTLFNFNSNTLVLTISAFQSSNVGIYALTYSSKLVIDNSYSASVSFQVQINKNFAPTPVMDFLTPVTLYAYYDYNWTVLFDADVEGDTPIFNVKLLDYTYTLMTNAEQYLFVNQSNDYGIIFSFMKAPNVSGPVQCYVQVSVSDSFNTLTPNLYNISLIVRPNYPPYLSAQQSLTIPSIYITGQFSFTIWYSNFTDDEGDSFTINCTTNYPNSNWISIQTNLTVAGNITFSGQTPRNNLYASDYTIACQVADQWNGKRVYNFALTVNPKPQIQILGTPQNQYILLPNALTLLMSNYSNDSLGVQNYFSLYINNTIYDPLTQSAWLLWDNMTQNITATPTMNSQAGSHSLSIMISDDINTPQFLNYTLEIVQNQPLITLKTLDNKQAMAFNWFQYDYNSSELFQNPEGTPFTMQVLYSIHKLRYFRQSQSNALPYFINKNYSNGTIGGYVIDSDVGQYQLECVGVDDSLVETVLSFTFTVKTCYYKCQHCWDTLYNTCTQCKQNYFLLNSECVDFCQFGTIADEIQRECHTCPVQCAVCDGGIAIENCSKCNRGYFYLQNGCYTKCPNGYYGDKSDYTCKNCHQSCSICYGPTSKQCSNCTEMFAYNDLGVYQKLGFMLVGTSCVIPQCQESQYFIWSKDPTTFISYGRCESCSSRCKKCTGPLSTQCILCYPGSILNSTDHTCTYCFEIAGYFTNEEYQCEDICGDGILLSKQCDDGNQNNGDGCSSECTVEQGFACRTPNMTCLNIIPPTFKIITISTINQVFIQFSEPITITSPSDISQSNLLVMIEGSQASYGFSWRIISDQNNPILPNRNITKFSIILEYFQQSMDGSEMISISFNDSLVIKDLSGNQVDDGQYAQINANPYIYYSPAEVKITSSGSSSIKYAFLSVLSFNLILKAVLSSSMQYLWGLVHALQIFNFLLYINIDFPQNVISFTQYFSMASGDMEELTQYIPNIADYLINQENVISAYDVELPQKFQDAGISPYFIFAYGQKLTIWGFLLIIFLPMILLMNKFCKTVKIWESIKSSFFFNNPLRGIVEQYIEVIMQIIINTQFIKINNRDSIIVTIFAFVFGAFLISLPFLTMSLIYKHRKKVKKEKWIASYGMLTDECQYESISQLYYYPMYIFQRLIIAGIIVYLQSSPLIQCGLIMLCNVMMTIYLIVVKPFEEENLQTTTVLDEMIICLCVGLFTIFCLKTDMSASQIKNLGWAIIVLIMFSVCKNFGIVIYFGVLKSKKSLQKMFGKDDEEIDSPHTSDEDDILQIDKNFNGEQYDFDVEKIVQQVKKELKTENRILNIEEIAIQE